MPAFKQARKHLIHVSCKPLCFRQLRELIDDVAHRHHAFTITVILDVEFAEVLEQIEFEDIATPRQTEVFPVFLWFPGLSAAFHAAAEVIQRSGPLREYRAERFR